MLNQYIVYCRKSSESEERQVLSIESQLQELKSFAERLHLPILDTITEARSAKSPGRTGFDLLMKKLGKGEAKGIITWKLDRLARNPVDGADLVMALDQRKIEEILTPHNSFRNNSNDKFLMQIEFGMAKKYVDDLSDNVKRGNKTKLEKGWLPGLPPLGYLNEPKDGTIIPDPEKFRLVRKMWDMFLQGTSVSHIHTISKDRWGLTTRIHGKKGGGHLSLSGVYRILTNSFYYGLIQRKEGVFIGKHKPMITEKEFWRVQELLGKLGKSRPKTREFAYTGLMRCGECGCLITAEEKVNRYGSHYIYYHCTWRRMDIDCHQRTIRLEDLENQIVSVLDTIAIPQDILQFILTYLNREVEDELHNEENVKSSCEKACRDCERKLETLNQMRLKELINDEEYVMEKRRLLDEKLALEQSLKEAPLQVEKVNELTAKTFRFANEAKKRFIDGTLQEKKAVLEGIGSNFILKDKKITFQLENPFILVQKYNQDLTSKKETFELSNNRMDTSELVSSASYVPIGLSLVKDVRTFFRDNEITFEIPYTRNATSSSPESN